MIEEGYAPNEICNRETENGYCKGVLEYGMSEMEAIGMGSTKSHLCCENCGFVTEWSYPKNEPIGKPQLQPRIIGILTVLEAIEVEIKNMAKNHLFFSNYTDAYKQGFQDGARLMEDAIMVRVRKAIKELKTA